MSWNEVRVAQITTRAAVRKESAETQDYVSELLRMSHPNHNMEAEDAQSTEELSFVPSAVSEPRCLELVLGHCGARQFGHASGKFL